MGQLRQKTLNDIYKLLDQTRLSSFNFDIISPEQKGLLIITFKANTNYYYKIDDDHNVIFSPGTVRTVETRVTPSGSELIAALRFIPEWVNHLIDELEATSKFCDEIATLINKIEQRISDQEINPEEKFEPEEQADLEAKIEKLAEQFEEFKKHDVLNETELNNIKKELQTLKEDLVLFPRGVWLRSAGQKILDPLKKIIKSKESRNILISIAKKLLLGD